jgi:hypothetical protein
MADDAQTQILRFIESSSAYAATYMFKIYYVDSSGLCYGQVRGVAGALLPTSEEIRAERRNKRPWRGYHHYCACSNVDFVVLL